VVSNEFFKILKPKIYPHIVKVAEADIDELNHATLLQNLEARYNRDEIYTYVGPIILAVNPFMNLNDRLYTDA
jgi:myosin heavy subunit